MKNLNTHKKLENHLEKIRELVAENELLKHIIKNLKNDQEKMYVNINKKEAFNMLNKVNNINEEEAIEVWNDINNNRKYVIEEKEIMNMPNNMAEFSKRYAIINSESKKNELNNFRNFNKKNEDLIIMSNVAKKGKENNMVSVPKIWVVFFENGLI